MLAYFVTSDWQVAFSLDPLYWPVKIFWMLEGGEPCAWLYYIVGLAYQSALVVLLLRRFKEAIYRWADTLALASRDCRGERPLRIG